MDPQVSDKHPPCPHCHSKRVIKNGSIHTGKPKYKCKDCNKQFVENPTPQCVPQEKRDIIDKLLLEKISLRGIARSVGVSLSWLQRYVNEKYRQEEWKVEDTGDPEDGVDVFILEADELWSFVNSKENKQWIWLVMNRKTRQILACIVGNRSEQSAQKLWEQLPELYRNNSIVYTDFLKSYACVIPEDQHQAVGKETGNTAHIERFNNTLRQRLSRLGRKTLSFSKSLFNHIGAIWHFIHYYNANLALS